MDTISNPCVNENDAHQSKQRSMSTDPAAAELKDLNNEAAKNQALAALSHPDIAAAIVALSVLQRPDVSAALRVLQRYIQNQTEQQGPPRKVPRSKLKPIMINNLFVITFIWTFIGIFLVKSASNDQLTDSESLAIFAVYGTVQSSLALFILCVTSQKTKKSHSRTITIGFLLQSWLALVLVFAGIYLFFQHAYLIGLVDRDDIKVR